MGLTKSWNVFLWSNISNEHPRTFLTCKFDNVQEFVAEIGAKLEVGNFQMGNLRHGFQLRNFPT